ncbi:unnamed protein product [Adineta steineri]|uniref:LamG-like jellyroll fold domain-containing protein n=1 Tax=Adineta steineri TaxID=433720 RepID=A0A818HWT0_9BILA|nr:unnamed protein product [Adineta steineri]CAF3512557.1 unnamed protein product [Adineta steineri]
MIFDDATFNLSDWGNQFQPANLVELLSTINVRSLIRCAAACDLNIQCRTFDYDSLSNVCRLFEGAINTGYIVPSNSSSRVGALQLVSNDFTSFGQPCSECTQTRYLTCLNNTCQCPPNTFWNNIECENQRYIDASCNNNQWCRYNTLGLICSIFNNCTTNDTLTTILPNCNTTCVSDTTVWSIPLTARWTFENTYEDSMLNYNATPFNSPTFVDSYVGQALSLDSSLDQYLSTLFIPLNERSLTIDAWIYPTSYPNVKGSHSIVGLCPQQTSSQCLEVFLQSNGTNTSSSTGIFSFWGSPDVKGSIPIYINQWTHIAFVYSKSKTKQLIYVNGLLDSSRTPSGNFSATSGNFYIGDNYNLTSYAPTGKNNFQGYIDQLTISDGVRPQCELLNVATLAASFTFDNISNIFDDSGPNDVSVNASNYTIVSGVKGGQAVSFTGVSSSYLQAFGFRFLSYNNTPFSLALWIQPISLQGILVGTSLGYPFLSFTPTQMLVVRIGVVSIPYNTPLQVGSTWTHIVQTWSSSNGIRLYVNNQLVANATTTMFTGSGTTMNSLILGGGTYVGAIDEWRVYSRELTPQDVCALFVA